MRNLKRVLSLALALVMVLGVMVMTGFAAGPNGDGAGAGAGGNGGNAGGGTSASANAGAAGFGDADKIADEYVEAVDVMNGIGVLIGDENGNFNPTDELERDEAAKIISYLVLGSAAADLTSSNVDDKPVFDDVPANDWSAGYVAYCANTGFIAGYGDGTYGPNDKLTGVAFAKLLLVALGYDAEVEGYLGQNWITNVAIDAVAAGITLTGIQLSAPLTREQAAQMAFQALQADTVEYKSKGMEIISTDGTVVRVGVQGPYAVAAKADADDFDTTPDSTTGKTVQLAEKLYPTLTKVPLVVDYDSWGQPTNGKGYGWKLGTKTIKEYRAAKEEPVAVYYEPTKNCVIFDDSGLNEGTKLDVYTNGVLDKEGYTVTDDTKSTYGEQGRMTAVYSNRIVNIDTYLGEVTKVTKETTDELGHVTAATIEVKVYKEGAENEVLVTKTLETTDYAKGDVLLVNVNEANKTFERVASDKWTVKIVQVAEAKDQQLTKIKGDDKVIDDDIHDILAIAGESVTINHTATLEPDGMGLGLTYTFYYDLQGNLMGAAVLLPQYAVLDSLYRTTDQGDSVANGTVVFFDASADEDADIARIYHATPDMFHETKEANDDAYHTVYAYTVEDGAYALRNSGFETAAIVNHEAGASNIRLFGENGKVLELSSSTQILLQSSLSPNGTFSAYVGYKDVPAFKGGNVQYLDENNDGYVEFLYICGVELTTRTVFIYDTTPFTSAVTEKYPGLFIAEVKALELNENGKLEETTIEVLYDDEYDDFMTDAIDSIGLYEVVQSQYGFWYAHREHQYWGVTDVVSSTDGKRVTIDHIGYQNLDNTIVVKYTGDWESGVYASSEAKNLTTKSLVFVQNADEDDTPEVIYDLYIKQTVTVNNKETKDVEYLGKDFTKITVELKEYEMIDTALMAHRGDFETGLTVKYFDKDDNPVADADVKDADKGAEVAYAVISYSDVVTGDVAITTKNQPAYTNAALKDGTYTFEEGAQSFKVENSTPELKPGDQYKTYGTITVDAKDDDVFGNDLEAAIARLALGTNYQTVIGVMNTETTEVGEDEVENDNFVLVKAWDGKTIAKYTITVATSDDTENPDSEVTS